MIKLTIWARVLLLLPFLSITSCGGASDTATEKHPASLNQAGYSGGSVYRFAFNSTPNIPFINAPADTDYSRYAILHDGVKYRLYFFKKGSSDTIYQFSYNATSQKYEFGLDAIPELKITGMPSDTDANSFAMLHDGATYRLYMKSLNNNSKIYQFGFNPVSGAYEYGHNSTPVLSITLAPSDADLSRWAMLFDGEIYRLYTGKTGTVDTIYQFAFNVDSSDYEWGFNNSIAELRVTNMPTTSIKSNFAMLHDGSDYRFYYPSIE
jgi:hypothetical protein